LQKDLGHAVDVKSMQGRGVSCGLVFVARFQRHCCILVLPLRAGTSRGITGRRRAARVWQDQAFEGRQFTAEVILRAVRWYLVFPISYRDLELMLLDRGVTVDHTTVFRWIQAYAGELESGSGRTCA
jgi:hypothetical protein